MVTHTKEPVVNCITGKNEKFSKHSFSNAKHQKSDVTIRIKTRDIENHYDNSSVYDKCVVADSSVNDKCVVADLLIEKKEDILSLKSKQLDQSLKLATKSVIKSFCKNKKDELYNLATNIEYWTEKIYKDITESSSKDILLLLDFIWFYPHIPIEFIPIKFRPTDDNNFELLDYVYQKIQKDEKLKEIFDNKQNIFEKLFNKHNILEKLFKYYEAVNNLGNFYRENLDMVLIEYFYTPITKFYDPCLVALYFTDKKEVDDIRIQNSSFVVEDYHVEYLDFCNLYTNFPDPHYYIPDAFIRIHTNGNKFLKIPDDFDANPGDNRYVNAIHKMSLRKLGLYKSCPLSHGLSPKNMYEVKHKMDEFGGLEFNYILILLVILDTYTLKFFEITTLFFRLLEIQKLLMQKVKAVNSVVINTIRYDINDEKNDKIFNDIRQTLERKRNELANKFDYLIYIKLFGEKIGVYEYWCKFHETDEDLEMKTPQYLKTKMISMLCAGCHPDQSGLLNKLFEQYEKNKKREKIEKV